jgi:hypothetical protein
MDMDCDLIQVRTEKKIHIYLGLIQPAMAETAENAAKYSKVRGDNIDCGQ